MDCGEVIKGFNRWLNRFPTNPEKVLALKRQITICSARIDKLRQHGYTADTSELILELCKTSQYEAARGLL